MIAFLLCSLYHSHLKYVNLGLKKMRLAYIPLILSTTLVLMSANTAVMAHEVATPQYNMVSIQASASRQIANDEMQAVLSIEKTHKSPSELAQQMNQLMNFATATAKKYPTVKIKTGQQSTNPIYDDSNRKIKDWRAYATVMLESQDMEATSKLIAELQQHFQLENVNFSVSEQQRKKVEDELLLEASKNFQHRANLIRQAWNKSSYDLVSFNVDTHSQYIAVPMMAMASSARQKTLADTQEMNAGESTITMNAHGQIQLK